VFVKTMILIIIENDLNNYIGKRNRVILILIHNFK